MQMYVHAVTMETMFSFDEHLVSMATCGSSNPW